MMMVATVAVTRPHKSNRWSQASIREGPRKQQLLCQPRAVFASPRLLARAGYISQGGLQAERHGVQ